MKTVAFKFEKSLFLSMLLLFSFAFTFYAATSWIVENQTLQNSFNEKIHASQSLFENLVKNDILIGLETEVYRKCKLFFRSGNVTSIKINSGSGTPICSLPDDSEPLISKTGRLESTIYFDETHKNIAATIQTSYSDSTTRDILKRSSWVLLIAILLNALVLAYFTRIISRYFSRPIHKLADILSSADLDAISTNLRDYNSHFKEIEILYKSIGEMAEKLHQAQLQLIEKTKIETIIQVASQVAHDIRSPIAALNMVVKQTVELPEQPRIMIRNAAQQINDIANNMLITHHRKDDANYQSTQPELIFTLLDNILSAKRAQYTESAIDISLHITDVAYGVFAQVDSLDFKRVISNLINNAVEAMDHKGNILVNLVKSAEKLFVNIQDFGCGMSKELIENVLKGGVSVGKKCGHGLGLVSSKNKVEAWGGIFNIKSKPNKGTTITLELSIVPPPVWFQYSLNVFEDSTLFILDDDRSIHDVWELRIQEELHTADKLKLIHFDHADAFLNYDHPQTQKAHYLIDYELLGSKITGLDVIEQCQIAHRTTLVTSRYEDPIIRERCEKLGCKILPKNYASYIPINLLPKNPDLVLVDDCKVLGEAWQRLGKLNKKNVMTLESITEAREIIPFLVKRTPIFIDSYVSEQERGEHFAKELFELGYCNLYLATGFSPDHFKEKMPWIKAIVGKDYPVDFKFHGIPLNENAS